MDAENILKAMSDSNRLSILNELKKGKKCANDLLNSLDISQSTLSHHMKSLCESDLVNCVKDGKWCFYTINQKALDEAKKTINSINQKPDYYEDVIDYCLKVDSKNPIEIFNNLSQFPEFGMLGIFHHILVGSALLTAYKNCGKDIDLKSSLIELQKRAEKIPPRACMEWGACGAAISAGIFLSVATGVSLESSEYFGAANGLTSKVLKKIKETGGPRCCKRHSYFALLTAIDYCNNNLGTNMESTKIKCKRSSENNVCIGKNCPFNKKNDKKKDKKDDKKSNKKEKKKKKK